MRARKLVDGAYGAMMQRLNSSTNPSLILLGYDKLALSVCNLVIIPKHYFVSSMIQARKPLAASARRAGWQGCNILLEAVPLSGKIHVVANRAVRAKTDVLADWRRTAFLRNQPGMEHRKWLLAVMRCVEGLGRPKFTLADVYGFEGVLGAMYPQNKNVRPKIRQQLQVLRDAGYLRFAGRGCYEIVGR